MDKRAESEDVIYDFESSVIYGRSKDIGIYGLTSVLNNIWAEGAVPAALGIHIFYGEDKSRIYAIKNRIVKSNFDVPISNIKFQFEQVLQCKDPWIHAYGMKKVLKELSSEKEGLRPGLYIVQAGYLALEGTFRIVFEKKGELLKRFAPSFISRMRDWDKNLLAYDMLKAGKNAGAVFMKHIGEHGLTQTLWDISEEADAGLAIDIKEVLLKQETVEICELYRMNPYRISSIGCVLMAAENGEALVHELKRFGYPASVIGRITDNNDKVILNGDDKSYMESQTGNEMLKLWQ